MKRTACPPQNQRPITRGPVVGKVHPIDIDRPIDRSVIETLMRKSRAAESED